MTINSEEAQQNVLEAAVERYRKSIRIESVESIRGGNIIDFNPKGWMLFAVLDRLPLRVGGTLYIAVHSETGEVRDLGIVGC